MPCSHRHGLVELLGLMFLCSAVEIHVLNRFARLERPQSSSCPAPFSVAVKTGGQAATFFFSLLVPAGENVHFIEAKGVVCEREGYSEVV